MDTAAIKIRRKWLTLTLILTFFPLGDAIILSQLTKTPEHFSVLSQAVGKLVLSIPFLWILIHCAYKKFGTAWLTFNMICGCMYLLIAIPLTLFRTFKSAENNELLLLISKLLFSVVVLILSNVIGMYWLVLSNKLRKVNKEIQYRLAMSSPEYQEGINLFEQATGLDDLNKKFYLLSSKHPGQLVVALDKAYQEKKRFFEKQSV